MTQEVQKPVEGFGRNIRAPAGKQGSEKYEYKEQHVERNENAPDDYKQAILEEAFFHRFDSLKKTRRVKLEVIDKSPGLLRIHA